MLSISSTQKKIRPLRKKTNMSCGEKKDAKGPFRLCVGCNKSQHMSDLVRVYVSPETDGGEREVAVDLRKKSGATSFLSPGRGAYVHPTLSCVEKACKVGFSRVFREDVRLSAEKIGFQLVLLANQRIESLLAVSKVKRVVLIGRDSVFDGLGFSGSSICEESSLKEGVRLGLSDSDVLKGGAKKKVQPPGFSEFTHFSGCLVVAGDAGSVSSSREVFTMVTKGVAIIYSTRRGLGKIFSREEVSLAYVKDVQIASEIKKCGMMISSFAGCENKLVERGSFLMQFTSSSEGQ